MQNFWKQAQGFRAQRQGLSRHLAASLLSVALISSFADQASAQGSASAPSAVEASIKQALEAWLKGKYKVDAVARSPIAGLYEVRLGTDLIYVDEKAAYAFIEGQLIDLKNNRNITRERTEELSAIQFKDLPLQLAFKQVQGSGRRVMAVFEDPNCGYCRKLRADLASLKDITIYTFVLPLLSPDSEVKSRNALCAGDKVKAWNDLMLSGKAPPTASPSCDAPIAKLKDLGRSLGVTGTPTIFFPNGKRLTGYAPMAQFEKMLDENNKI
ncbi:MAG: DsbC family protein [Betaproteobacteria bacterium]|jgi:thiol:disulfide interchange protein DsbC|nr:DsbC family protein [Betaproteobacteria bacterium]NBP35722.1 DsbC family protein [Betaproteobacteria bacterium]NBP38010.1 DsbC family protein [Betaproteobacteria bacterium]NBQ79335.1 DsbC family protein [Betaproteobacteria bacterium]NBQ95864.1 DsbC family protein [Betaproteobacteria bacterium]